MRRFWEHDPGDIFIPLDVMRAGRAPGDLHVVVMALQQTLAIDVKGLGGTVRGDIVGIADLEASPGFSIFLPWRKLFREDARMREQERSVKVGPHRTAREVCQLQCAPRRFKCMTGEGRARLPQFLQDLARRALERDPVGLEPGR